LKRPDDDFASTPSKTAPDLEMLFNASGEAFQILPRPRPGDLTNERKSVEIDEMRATLREGVNPADPHEGVNPADPHVSALMV
jgi:hypothetical protein